jgi:hypothetical protein
MRVQHISFAWTGCRSDLDFVVRTRVKEMTCGLNSEVLSVEHTHDRGPAAAIGKIPGHRPSGSIDLSDSTSSFPIGSHKQEGLTILRDTDGNRRHIRVLGTWKERGLPGYSLGSPLPASEYLRSMNAHLRNNLALICRRGLLVTGKFGRSVDNGSG